MLWQLANSCKYAVSTPKGSLRERLAHNLRRLLANKLTAQVTAGLCPKFRCSKTDYKHITAKAKPQLAPSALAGLYRSTKSPALRIHSQCNRSE